MDKCVISRVVMVAGGRFAPGHLGELTQQVPFEMVDAALEETRRMQRRVRVLPARVVVYLLLAGCLFAELGYAQVWDRMTAGLDGLPVASPTASALTQARRRLGPGPLRELFALLRGPFPAAARWRGLLVCAIDGTIMTVADSKANLAPASNVADRGISVVLVGYRLPGASPYTATLEDPARLPWCLADLGADLSRPRPSASPLARGVATRRSCPCIRRRPAPVLGHAAVAQRRSHPQS